MVAISKRQKKCTQTSSSCTKELPKCTTLNWESSLLSAGSSCAGFSMTGMRDMFLPPDTPSSTRNAVFQTHCEAQRHKPRPVPSLIAGLAKILRGKSKMGNNLPKGKALCFLTMCLEARWLLYQTFLLHTTLFLLIMSEHPALCTFNSTLQQCIPCGLFTRVFLFANSHCKQKPISLTPCFLFSLQAAHGDEPRILHQEMNTLPGYLSPSTVPYSNLPQV